MPDSKPAKVDVFYKLRSAPMHALKSDLRLDDPEQDSDQITAGVQNEGEFEVPFDRNDEKYDVFFRSYNVHGEGEPIGIRKELFRVNIDQVGGLSRAGLSFVISDPGDDNAFIPDDVIQIEDEFLVVSDYDNQTRTITVEERGAHASPSDSYADNTSVILCRYTVPHKSIVMVGDVRELDPPQILLVPVLGGFLIVATAPADPDNTLDAYIIFRSDSSPALLQQDVVKVRAGQATHTFVHFLPISANRAIPWYIRVKSVTRSGIIGSAFSNEVSGKPLLSDEEAEAGEPNAPNMEVLADGGGFGEQDFRFLFGIELQDQVNIAGISETQLQVAGPSAAHFPNAGFSAAILDKVFARKPPFATYLTVMESSAEIGGAYQFSARMYNSHADIWSDWSNPVSAFTLAGAPDIGTPDEPREFSLLDIIDAGDVSGDRFTFTIKEPLLNSRTIWQYEIQGSTSLFSQFGNEGIEDNTGLLGIQVIGTGSVTLGESTLTVATGGIGAFAEDEFARKIIYVHEGMATEGGTNNFTGEIIFPQAFTISGNTVDANGNVTTISLRSDEKFRLNGDPGSGTRIINWIIANDWQNADTLIVRSFRFSSLVVSGTPDSEIFRGEISSGPTRYWRVRAWNRPGSGKWLYSDGLFGDIQASNAVAFQTSSPEIPEFPDLTVSKGFQAQITSDVRFSALDNNSVEWTSGTAYYPDGDNEDINSGSANLGNNQTYWVYKTIGNSTLNTTTNPAAVLSENRVLVAQIVTTSEVAELASIVTPWMLGSTFTAAAINVNRLSAITANIGTITAGTITGLFIRTAAAGKRIEITDSNKIDFYGDTGFQFADIEPVVGFFGTDLRIRTLGIASSIVFVAGRSVIFNSDLSLAGNDIFRAGEVELDSLIKDGSGEIQIASDIKFDLGKSILFVGNEQNDIGSDANRAANIYANATILDALALREGQDFAAQAGRTIIYVDGSGTSRQVKIRYPDGTTADLPGSGGGLGIIDADVDFQGFDALNIGEVGLDALRKDGAGSIAIESILEFAAGASLLFAGNEVTDIGSDARRAANIYANATILDALALRENQDFAAQAGRTIIYVEGSGTSHQVKIRYPDGSTADLPGAGGGAFAITEDVDFGGFSALNIGEVELDSLRKDGPGPITIEDILEFASSADLHFAGNEVTDIGTDTRRVANIWANATILDALALRENQDFAAQAGRSVLYLSGSGGNAQLKIVHSDGRTEDIPAGETTPTMMPTANLSASSTSITPGSSVVLSWNSTNGVSASINQGIGSVGLSGNRTVTPSSTRTYTLTVTGEAGTTPATDSVRITVIDTTLDPPTVDSFSASPSTIDEGDSSTLSWTTTGATSVSIDEGVGSNLAVDGNVSVSPTETTTYTITATNDDGTDTDTTTVTVDPVGSAPTIDSFSVSPSTIDLGDSVTISWQTTDATSVRVSQRLGPFVNTLSTDLNGSVTYTPVSTSHGSFEITATNSVGSVSESDFIIINP